MKIYHKIFQLPKRAAFLLLLTTLSFLLTITSLKAQFNPLNAQYFLNPYQINPAYAGFTDGLNVNLNYRKQWSNIPGSPSTQSVTADYKMKRVGLGVNIYDEKAGSLLHTKAVASYAYHIILNNKNQKLNFGVSVGITKESIDYSEVNGDLTDLDLVQFNDRGALFDGDFGIAYTSDKLNIEAVVPNIRSSIQQDNNYNVDRSRFYAAASYKINTGMGANSIEIEPKAVFRGIKGFKNIIDVGSNFNFTKKVFMMAMYHSTESASFGLGFNYQTSVAIMGFYTTETSALQNSANGIFEISLKATLFK